VPPAGSSVGPSAEPGRAERARAGDFVIAIDGGGSKTAAVAVGLDGSVLARADGAGSNPQSIGLPRTVEIIDALVRELVDAAGAAAGGAAGGAARRVHVYLSGMDLPREINGLSAELNRLAWAQALPGRTVTVENDLFALLRAGTTARDAVAIVCGTGTNAIGQRSDGRTIRFLAVGPISGDWGGGWQLGEEALWHGVRGRDRRGPPTALSELIPARLGYRDIDEVSVALYLGELPEGTLAGLSPLVFEAAAAGDAVAGTIVARQAEEIALMAHSVISRLDLLDAPVPVVLGGGVIAAQHAALAGAVLGKLAELAPRAEMVVVTHPPLLGGALLALEDAGAGPAALDRAVAELGARTTARRVPTPAR